MFDAQTYTNQIDYLKSHCHFMIPRAWIGWASTSTSLFLQAVAQRPTVPVKASFETNPKSRFFVESFLGGPHYAQTPDYEGPGFPATCSSVKGELEAKVIISVAEMTV